MPHRPMNREQVWMLPPRTRCWGPVILLDLLLSSSMPWMERAGQRLGLIETDGSAGLPSPCAVGCVAVRLHDRCAIKPKLEAACCDQIPYLWLTGCQRPDHVTLWRFYLASGWYEEASSGRCRRRLIWTWWRWRCTVDPGNRTSTPLGCAVCWAVWKVR